MARTTRRHFIKWAALGAWAARSPRVVRAMRTEGRIHQLIPEPMVAPQGAPSDRVRIATIGMGGQGMADTMAALRVPGVELVAVA
ncbi:MAG TPA: gfo/Idh/MocA family oxidoreductase, partial [Blastocatellia bacterium]|nr:gfo/Idh/MocA family oxidoreductase [Blastocatellia bacterium]